MALLDKNIIITPYVGSATSDPRIEFRGADSTSGPNVISAVISPSNSGTLSFEGTAGQLFSITNNLTTGSIFSVNDVSGMPSIDVNANGTVSMVAYGDSVGIGTTNPSQKLHIQGNVRITGALYDINNSAGSSNQVLQSVGTGISWTTLSTSSVSYATTAGISTNVIGGIGSISQLQVTGVSTFTNGPVLIGAATSTGTASQPLQVTGGAYVSENLGIGTTNPPYKLSITDANAIATPSLTNVLADFTANTNSFSQINTRNASSGANASSDIIATADTGTDTTNYIDLGINNSGYSGWSINGALDGYLYTSDTNLSIGAANNKYVSIFTGGTTAANERLRVTGTGNIGIGTTNPLQQLQVGFGTNVVVVDSTGELGIGTTNPTSKLHVIGDVLATGNVTALQFTSTSDRNQKKNITPIKDAINIVNQLEGVRFNWVESNKPSIGVIAQDIERILPEVVETSQNGTKSVLYGNIIGVLIEAIKDQQIQIQELERKLDA
jgi:hypothetical protein